MRISRPAKTGNRSSLQLKHSGMKRPAVPTGPTQPSSPMQSAFFAWIRSMEKRSIASPSNCSTRQEHGGEYEGWGSEVITE